VTARWTTRHRSSKGLAHHRDRGRGDSGAISPPVRLRSSGPYRGPKAGISDLSSRSDSSRRLRQDSGICSRRSTVSVILSWFGSASFIVFEFGTARLALIQLQRVGTVVIANPLWEADLPTNGHSRRGVGGRSFQASSTAVSCASTIGESVVRRASRR